MPHIDLSQFASPVAQWFRRDPTLAVEIGLSTEPLHYGSQNLENLTPAGRLLFEEDGILGHLVPDSSIPLEQQRQDLEVRAWMMLEEGWCRKSWIVRTMVWDGRPPPPTNPTITWYLHYPFPLPPSVAKTLQHFFSISGIIRHRCGGGFISDCKLSRQLVPKDPALVEHVGSRAGAGEMWVEVSRPEFHPHVRWTLQP